MILTYRSRSGSPSPSVRRRIKHPSGSMTCSSHAIEMMASSDGVCAIREIVDAAGWRSLADGLNDCTIDAQSCPSSISITASTPTVLLGQSGNEEAYDAVAGARRPVLGVARRSRRPRSERPAPAGN